MSRCLRIASFIFIFSFIFANALAADEPSQTPQPAEKDSTWEKVKEKAAQAYEVGKEKAHAINTSLNEARENRASKNWTITGNYSLYEMWVLSKKGITFAYTPDASISYEFEYMKGSIGFGYFGIDIGEIKEQRISFLARSFNQRNTFNFLAGVYYNKLDITLGSDLLKTLSSDERLHVDLMDLETMGLTWGLGNRWQTKKGFVWGFDWLVINIPLRTTKQKVPYLNSTATENDKDEVKDALKVLKTFPSFGVVKIQLGVSF